MTPTRFPSLMSLRKGPRTAAKLSEFPGKNLSGGLAPGGPRPQTDILERNKKVVVVLGGGSFGTAMAARVTNKKNQSEVYMLVRDPLVCQSINETHYNSRYFPEHKLPDNVIATTNAKVSLLGADYCHHAVRLQQRWSVASKDKKLSITMQQLIASQSIKNQQFKFSTGLEDLKMIILCFRLTCITTDHYLKMICELSTTKLRAVESF